MIPGLKPPMLDDQNRLYCPPGSSKTKQTFKEECDINTIVRKFIRTGVLDENSINHRQAAFMDATAVPGYQECLERIQSATAAFQTLPASTREMFDNNPASLIEWMDDPINKAEAQDLGLIPKDPEPTPAPGGEQKG